MNRRTAQSNSPKPAKAPPLHLSITALVGGAYAPVILRHLRAAHRLLAPPLQDLSLVIVNDQAMARLHLQYLNLAGPTDVLTFPLDTNADGKVASGEVIICLPEARRQAKTFGHRIENELLLYALHGMLHLCDFDDRTKNGFLKMHTKEDWLMTKMGLSGISPLSTARNGLPSGAR